MGSTGECGQGACQYQPERCLLAAAASSLLHAGDACWGCGRQAAPQPNLPGCARLSIPLASQPRPALPLAGWNRLRQTPLRPSSGTCTRLPGEMPA